MPYLFIANEHMSTIGREHLTRLNSRLQAKFSKYAELGNCVRLEYVYMRLQLLKDQKTQSPIAPSMSPSRFQP